MIERYDLDARLLERDPSQLVAMPRVVRIGDVDDDCARAVAQEVSIAQSTGQTVLPVVVDSPGGDAYAMLAILDTLAASRVPVATIAVGRAFSCGATIFACGTHGKRYAAPGATFLVHDVTSTRGGDAKAGDLKTETRETVRLNRRNLELLAQATGKSRAFFESKLRALGHSDWYFDAREAKRLGLVDVIGVPTLLTTVRVETVLA